MGPQCLINRQTIQDIDTVLDYPQEFDDMTLFDEEFTHIGHRNKKKIMVTLVSFFYVVNLPCFQRIL